MKDSSAKTKLHVLGVHLNSEGYPNVRYRIQDFRQADWLSVIEINRPMWKKGGRSNHGIFGALLGLLRAIYAHLSVFVRYLIGGRATLVYIPYPSVFMALMLSILPRAVRPDKIVLEGVISLYDTVVNDRKLLSRENWLSIFLKYLEMTAYSNADLVIVDTPQSMVYICNEFNLAENKVVDVPLSTDEQKFQLQPYMPNDEICRVLFIGTFVPLQGVSTILSAAEKLKDCQNIQFRIVGTGQTAAKLEGVVKKQDANLEWIRAWQTSEVLAAMIEEADICLGIFGSGEKTQRVCPFKIYTYAACGRAIITGDTQWTRHIGKNLSYEPFEIVPVNDAAALAERIEQLAGSSQDRRQLAENSRKLYEEKLCNKIALSKFKGLFCGS